MAAPEIQVGVARIFGLGDAAGIGAATIESSDLEHKFKLDESLGQSGTAETLFATNEQFEVSINFAPQGDVVQIPEPLAQVTLADFPMAVFNRVYLYIGGGTVKLVRDKECVMGLKLRSYPQATAELGTT